LKHGGKEEAEGKTYRRRFTLMNADQERRVKFEAETNYNKGFRLTRQDCMGSVVYREP